MPAKETGKQRATWIRMDYFKHPDRLQRWKGWLGMAALVLSLGWVAGAILWIDQGRAGESRGPVAAVHATWENHCTACHEPFMSISGKSWTVWPMNETSASDQKCQSCHAGPTHHLNQKPELACAACHRDHGGRDARLVRLPDSDCTQCHTDLMMHLRGKSQSLYQNSVRRFDADPQHHPDFRSIKAGDPSKLKFNHALHMKAGMAMKDGGPVWRLHDIPEPYRKRYEDADQQMDKRGKAFVQLSCASCHALDPGDFHGTDGPSHVLGSRATMQPIAYDNQCKACHFLTFDRQKAGDRNSPVLAVPHGLQPQEVRDFLWGAYANEHVLATHPELLKQPIRPLPGRPLPAEEKEARDAIDKRLADYEKYLYLNKLSEAEKKMFAGKQTCGECHYFDSKEGQTLPRRILPTNVPVVWFQHADFDHAAHRALDCRACHERAYPDHPRASTDAKDVLVPAVDTCLKCHAPQTATGGGARFDCTECHRYHHRGTEASRAQGLGAGARGPIQGPRGIGDFLSGELSGKSNRGP